jgi:hypothetical protein
MSTGFKRIELKTHQKSGLEAPFGYTKSFSAPENTVKDTQRKNTILSSQAKAAAFSPGSQIFMQLFMMWMMGSSLHIFSIFMIYQMMSGPISSMMTVNQKFARFSTLGNELAFYKLIYIGINLGVLGMGLYKLNTMGLLPLNPSDYVELIPKADVPFLVNLEQFVHG